MVRGTTWFRCPRCGYIYKALDIEEGATILSMPMPCPRCGANGYVIGYLGWLRKLSSKVLK